MRVIHLSAQLQNSLISLVGLLFCTAVFMPQARAVTPLACQKLLLEKGQIITRIKERLSGFFDRHPTIRADNYRELDEVFNKDVLLGLLEEIIESPKLLSEVARRSYAHSLGFNKIILIEDWKQHFFEKDVPPGKHGYDIRLHIWWPQKSERSGLAMAEGRHEHKWDFTSRLITGRFENQRYEMSPLTDEQSNVFKKFEAKINSLSKERAIQVRERLDLLEIAELHSKSQMASLSGGVDFLKQSANEAELLALLGMSRSEFDIVRNVFLKYANQIRQLSSEEAYTAVGPVFLRLKDVETYKAGDLYFHPIELAHRLFVNPTEFASTFIVVAPPYKDHQPGQLVRPGAEREESDIEHRQFYAPETLKEELQRYLREVRK